LISEHSNHLKEAALVQRVTQQSSMPWQWHAHRFPYSDSHCVVLCHDDTGYIMVMPDFPCTDPQRFIDGMKDLLAESIQELGFTSAEAMKLLLALGPVSIDDQCNNKVKEVMSVAWQDLHNFLQDRPDIRIWNPVKLNELINQRIIKKDGEWRRPDELFRQWAEEQLKQLP
jgi:hypothetical protein